MPLEATMTTIDGHPYIVDDHNGNIFVAIDKSLTNSDLINLENLKLVGKKQPDNTITWYTPESGDHHCEQNWK